jgi:HlyD family secretion protein
MRLKKVIVILAIVVLLIGGVFLLLKPKGQNPQTQYIIAKVEKKDLCISITTTGEVKPILEVEIKSKASGKVIKFKKREGDRILAKEVFVELERDDELRNYNRQYANFVATYSKYVLKSVDLTYLIKKTRSELEAATQDYLTKKNEYERVKALPPEATTQRQIDEAKLARNLAYEKLTQTKLYLKNIKERKNAEIQLAYSDLLNAWILLSEAEDRLKDTKLSSPIDGILLKKYVEEGQIISSGITAIGGGTPVALVADISKMKIIANVDETDIGKVFVNQECIVTVDAYPDKKIKGKVNLIPPQGVIDKNIVVFKVEILVEEEGVKFLKPGMTANVEIITQQKTGATVVPAVAIEFDGRNYYVYIPPIDNPQKRTVKVGITTGDITEIVQGLKEGDTVLIARK